MSLEELIKHFHDRFRPDMEPQAALDAAHAKAEIQEALAKQAAAAAEADRRLQAVADQAPKGKETSPKGASAVKVAPAGEVVDVSIDVTPEEGKQFPTAQADSELKSEAPHAKKVHVAPINTQLPEEGEEKEVGVAGQVTSKKPAPATASGYRSRAARMTTRRRSSVQGEVEGEKGKKKLVRIHNSELAGLYTLPQHSRYMRRIRREAFVLLQARARQGDALARDAVEIIESQGGPDQGTSQEKHFVFPKDDDPASAAAGANTPSQPPNTGSVPPSTTLGTATPAYRDRYPLPVLDTSHNNRNDFLGSYIADVCD